MSDNKILDAVLSLDVDNDNHWTAEGLPRLDTIKMLASDPTLNREKVDAAVPGFSRGTAKGYTLPEAPVPPAPVEQAAPAGQTVDQASEPKEGAEGSMPPEIAQGVTGQGANLLATEESDLRDAIASTAPSPNAPISLGGTVDDGSLDGAAPASGAGEAQLGTLENGSSGDPDALEALEAELAEAEEYSAKLKEARDHLDEELGKSVRHESDLRAKIEAARPRNGVMPAIQAYFASQDEALNNVAAVRNALADSGIDLEKIQAIVGKSPVDKAAAAEASKPQE